MGGGAGGGKSRKTVADRRLDLFETERTALLLCVACRKMAGLFATSDVDCTGDHPKDEVSESGVGGKTFATAAEAVDQRRRSAAAAS